MVGDNHGWGPIFSIPRGKLLVPLPVSLDWPAFAREKSTSANLFTFSVRERFGRGGAQIVTTTGPLVVLVAPQARPLVLRRLRRTRNVKQAGWPQFSVDGVLAWAKIEALLTPWCLPSCLESAAIMRAEQMLSTLVVGEPMSL